MQSVLPTAEADRRRFWAKVDRRNGGCWPWTGRAKFHDGRGRFLLNGRAVIASRVAWAIANGREPDGWVIHSCDYPPCCNPAHLSLGTPADNVRDMMERRRHWSHAQTHCKHGHEFTPENTVIVKGKWRKCLACARQWKLADRRARGVAPRHIFFSADGVPLCRRGHERTPGNLTAKRECRACKADRNRVAREHATKERTR